MDPPVAAGLADGSIDAVLHYSRRSASLFRDMAAAAGVDPSGVLHICISDDAAAPLFTARYHRIAIAAEPEETAMIALLAAFIPQAGTAKTTSGTPARG
jgi:uroporphyrinogen-III synthase